MGKTVFVFLLVLVIAACASQPAPLPDSKTKYHVVRQGENIDSIAFALELEVDRLKLANPWLNPSNIKTGMRLKLPGSSGTRKFSGAAHRWPLNNIDVSSGLGLRRGRLHSGIDLRAPRGTRIMASADGRVSFSDYKNGYGYMIIIDHSTEIQTVYGHNNKNLVKKGQLVNKGQVIATVGRSGNATGFHVHFEFRRLGRAVNPSGFIVKSR